MKRIQHRLPLLKLLFILTCVCIGCSKQKHKKIHFVQGDSIPKMAKLINSKDSLSFFNDLKKPTLVFKYSELNCNVCVDSVVSVLKNFRSKTMHTVFIADYSNTRNLHIFKRINNLKNEVYRTSFKSEADGLEVPYVYVLDEALIQKSVFIPIKENLKPFRTYLKVIEAHYSQK